MRVLLVGPDFEENLSIRYLSAALLQAGHQTELVTFNSASDASEVVSAARDADLVGLSMCFQSRAADFLEVARGIKELQSHKFIVAGGHYASCAAEPLLGNHAALDAVVIHEGEATLVEMADALPGIRSHLPNIHGIAYRDGKQIHFTPARRAVDDLDSMPFPDRRGPVRVIAGVPTSYMMGSRGCYGHCAYCCITTLHRMAPGKRFRQRSPENVADEMSRLYHDRGTRQYIFHDDNFLVPSQAMNHARLSALQAALRRRQVRDIALVIKCRPADASKAVLTQLKELGLVRLFMGVESSTAAGLSTLERAQTIGDSERALDVCADLGISAQFTIMAFHPAATLETLRADVAFMRRYAGNPLNFCRTEIYAGTPLEKKMIDLSRARGDYLARDYSIEDPCADMACTLSLRLFHERCWMSNSLMQHAIGLDHVAAVAAAFYAGRQQEIITERVHQWLRSLNLDTLALLEEVIELSSSDRHAADFESVLQDIQERERESREMLLSEGFWLREQLQSLRTRRTSASRLAPRAAAVLLAVGMPAVASHAATLPGHPQAQTSATAQDRQLCALSGTITDRSGAAIANAEVTIRDRATGATYKLKTDAAGKYIQSALSTGTYDVKVAAANFETASRESVVLRAGTNERVDFALQINAIGCCEYAAVPLNVPPENLQLKKKPFTYFVNEGRNRSLKQIAEQVYGNSHDWVLIFGANRNALDDIDLIPAGTALTIPPKPRDVPRLVSKVSPAYPAKDLKAHARGDVVLELTLSAEGAVEKVDVLYGQPVLSKVALEAVRQWRFKPTTAEQRRNLYVGITFTKGGKVTYSGI